MNRSFSRSYLAEACAAAGVCFGAWLIHHTFQPDADTPNAVLLFLGVVDILICCFLLSHMLRLRLRDGERLPKGWIITGVVLIAAYLGWITALLKDAERLRAEQFIHREANRHLEPMEDAVQQFQQLLPAVGSLPDRQRWDLVHNRYAREHDQLQVLLREKPNWAKDLTTIHEQVQTLHQLVTAPHLQGGIDPRGDGQQLRERTHQQIEKLQAEIAAADQDLASLYRARWHGIAATALTGVFLLLGCMLPWFVFDRELRRQRKAQVRLAELEARYRSLVERQGDAVAVLDAANCIVYANGSWETSFNYQMDEIQARPILELIHPEDRPQVQLALQQQDAQHTVPCRLSADYGVWHDVELQCQQHDDPQTSAIRIRNLRETPDVPDVREEPSILKLPDLALASDIPALVYLYDAAARHFVSVSNLPLRMLGYAQTNDATASDFLQSILHPEDEARVFRKLALRDDAVSEDEIRLRDADGHYQWFAVFHRLKPDASNTDTRGSASNSCVAGVAFPLQQHKRAAEEHAESDGRLQRLAESEKQARLELQNAYKEYEKNKKSYEAKQHEGENQRKLLEKSAREREERSSKLEAELRDREQHCKQIEQRLREREREREDMEATVREHEEKLHDLNWLHDRHAASLQASKEAMRRLASGVANDFNKILSVVLGYTDVLRESFPKDHLAQAYVTEMAQAASHGAELTQKLLAFSGNHLLQMIPVELNGHLAAFEAKLRDTLGRDMELRWQRAASELWIKTDPGPLEQALVHLLTHVRQRQPHGGTLTIGTNRVALAKSDLPLADMTAGSYVRLYLQYQDSDMDEETRTHLFEPYYPTREGHKTDLSLATANGIIRQSGGSINMESTAGAGHQIVILLPWTDERPQHEASPLRASA